MCGIFGIASMSDLKRTDIKSLSKHSQRRGSDSSGLLILGNERFEIIRSSEPIGRLLAKTDLANARLVMGHSRLKTNGNLDNQPLYRDDVILIHNGIVVNADELWLKLGLVRHQEIDSEIIAAIAADALKKGTNPEDIAKEIFEQCRGSISAVLALPKLGKLCLFSNNGSLYVGNLGTESFFASERYSLEQLKCLNIKQVKDTIVLDIPTNERAPSVKTQQEEQKLFLPSLGKSKEEENQLKYVAHSLKRCNKCILPETMPFIAFDTDGVCNYCANYTLRNAPKPLSQLKGKLEPFRRENGSDCIVPFSGGRDSSFALHLIVNEFKMKPIAYTYDWGMVTDLGRRNISRMCAELGVENIVVAANIQRKRDNIAMNLKAWLKSPNLGLLGLLTAGDKHFFRYVQSVQRQTGISLNMWGVNPLEVTHFKTGFLGIPPDFSPKSRVYSTGLGKQISYQSKRFLAMTSSPGYFNSSLWDTLTGEYYRSVKQKSEYLQIFDYWKWDEVEIDTTLSKYDWEMAPDTVTSWRIGDATAAFYNYVYYTVAGFTEHDTFRSNQIREGDLDRSTALELVNRENRPRYPNVKWYLDALGMDFDSVIRTVNSIPRLGPSMAWDTV